MANKLYEISAKKIDGSPATIGDYKGSVLLIVNVASKCGLTPQYSELEKIYETYRDKGFYVLGFPSNEFAGQEPGSNAEVLQFCQTNFGVKFPMFEKIQVKGDGQHPLYRHLIESIPTAQAKADSALRKTLDKHGLGPKTETEIAWNFEKFVVDRKGNVVARFAPDITPTDPGVTGAIEAQLAQPA